MRPERELELRSRRVRREQEERSWGMEPVRLASETTRVEREGRAAQRPSGRGSASGTDWMVMEVTVPAESQAMWVQLHGLESDGFQSENALEGDRDDDLIQLHKAMTPRLVDKVAAEEKQVGSSSSKKKSWRR